jgi:protein SCO1/2
MSVNKTRALRNALIAAAIIIAASALVLQQTRPVEAENSATTTAAIGGDFRLVNQDGKAVSSATYNGKYRLVFFGFTHCPGMCPMAMGTISSVLEDLPKEQQTKLAPLFVSVDGERDSPAVIKTFLESFHPSFQGLTGNKTDVDAMVKQYRAYYQADTKGVDGNYNVNHTGLIYLMNPKGEYISFFPHDVSAEILAEGFRKVL